MEPVIETKSLVKSFSKQIAIDGIDFSVHRKEIFGFLGPSGSGKTTTIKILTGQLSPTKGEATLFGVPSQLIRKKGLFKKIGILTDNSGLYDRLTIEENLRLYCKLFDVQKERMDEVLSLVKLYDEQRKKVSELSKGMKQRVLLARVLIHEPELLFLDEPTSALDPVNAQQIYKGLKELNEKGTTIFLTTHNMQEAELLCDRIAFLNHGKIQLLGEPKKIRRDFSDTTITIELKNGRKEVLQKDKDSAKIIYQYMTADEVESIYSNEPTLGDIFLKITGRELI
ncbi:ABC transporter ATP-binding protein [Bacillus carboniphilus]|uniref:ABC transporter ATP-binding protein n=1 Tax=Bacillus carboniphilus TaxID=86663 RepID=A0ABY9JRV5_9BACI|nr:ABC transporter ATP-binding protein [Bacillus carboniphilus]WLR42139.1 ABC transporter ATP-binding protein [Bacillus carboniphilus]